MKKDNYFWIYILVGGLLLLLTQSCAPIFSEVQSARTVGQGNFELTPAYSDVSFGYDGEKESMQKQFGLHLAYGLSDKIDLRVRYESVLGEEINVLGIGPKFNLIENRVSVYLPIGSYIGEGMTWDLVQFHPTLLLTQPIVDNNLEITAAPKLLIPVTEPGELLTAINFNLAISSDLDKWAIRPEYGLLFKLGEEGHYSQFGVALSLTMGSF